MARGPDYARSWLRCYNIDTTYTLRHTRRLRNRAASTGDAASLGGGGDEQHARAAAARQPRAQVDEIDRVECAVSASATDEQRAVLGRSSSRQ